VLIAGATIAAVSSPGNGHQTITSVSNNKTLAHAKKEAAPAVKPLRVVSVTPHDGARGVNGAGEIKVTFSAGLTPLSPLPSLSPKVDGSWQVSGDTATFTPRAGYLEHTTVTLNVPGGASGVRGEAGKAGFLAKSSTVRFTTGAFSTTRLQQLLTQLGYLPLAWTPEDQPAGRIPETDADAQLSAAYDPPPGSFAFHGGYPSQLTSQWRAGEDNMLDAGAIRAFESSQGLTMDGVVGPTVWSHLLKAVAKNLVNPNGYTYALADQHSPETLTVWHNGKVLLTTPVNTGISGRATQDGTFPVYLRYQFNYMDGTNPDGSKYHDPVYWISYFNGGDAVHYFARASYGSYQSLGCVEAPLDPAKKAWKYMTYGTLVTVAGPVS
jgi:peptidoglycan hydrolase-like protein with peptidoglycan-binding domain